MVATLSNCLHMRIKWKETTRKYTRFLQSTIKTKMLEKKSRDISMKNLKINFLQACGWQWTQ